MIRWERSKRTASFEFDGSLDEFDALRDRLVGTMEAKLLEEAASFLAGVEKPAEVEP